MRRRLETAQTAGSHWSYQWTYDRYGNRIEQDLLSGTGPEHTLSVDTATNRVTGWSYDAAGNVLDDGLHTYTYDANNQIKELDGGTVVYRYDGSGERVMKVTAGETIYYIPGGEASSLYGLRKMYVTLGGKKIVEYSNSTTYFFHHDHTGTPRAQTNIARQRRRDLGILFLR